MIRIRRADDRGRTELGWLDSRHTFSFGDYRDPAHAGFHSLRVLNDDRVVPSAGFGTHGHRDMEILSYVLDGALEHRDSMGNGSIIRPNEIQFMRAGTGVMHSEKNPSATEPVHFLQIWIIPPRKGSAPAYAQQAFDVETARNGWVVLASPDGRAGSIQLEQDTVMSVTRPAAGARRSYALAPGRHAWVHVARGSVVMNDESLHEGDGAALSDERSIEIAGVEAGDGSTAEVLVFDLG
jgi:redox-sensitive bicupin YhaK (pirin superfamily)